MHALLPFTRKQLYFAMPDNPPAGGDPPNGDPPDGQGEKKSYTQPELDAMFNDRAKRAAAAERTKLLAELGVDDVDIAKSRLATAKVLEESNRTELQKAQDLAAAEKTRADTAEAGRSAAVARALENALRAALMAEATKQGIDETELGTAWLEFRDSKALREMVTADEDDNFTGLDKAVKKIVEAHPRWMREATIRARDTNATRRGGTGETPAEELVARKKKSGNYSAV